ncbi:MAG: type III polyketide synthase [Bdellovibrionota bacterium]
MSRILSLSTVSPEHRYSTEEIAAAAEKHWLCDTEEKTRNAALKIFRGADIRERYSVVPLETVFSALSFQEKNDLYITAAKELAEKALLKACEQADISPRSLDYLITTSCTGFMIPSVDAYLVDKLGLSQNVVRLPVTEMGCAGGSAGLIYADRILRGHSGARAAVVAVEAPSITFQRNDHSMENLVSTAIFADGAACAILGEGRGPEILDSSMYHFPESTHLMGYRLTNEGLKIVLDRDVPEAITAHFERYFLPLLNRNHLGIKDVSHFVFHPGGKKIVQSVEKTLAPFGKNVDASRRVLRDFGNLSSATVFFVLNEVLSAKPQSGDIGYLLAFGPGFSAQGVLLRW